MLNYTLLFIYFIAILVRVELSLVLQNIKEKNNICTFNVVIGSNNILNSDITSMEALNYVTSTMIGHIDVFKGNEEFKKGCVKI